MKHWRRRLEARRTSLPHSALAVLSAEWLGLSFSILSSPLRVRLSVISEPAVLHLCGLAGDDEIHCSEV